ncbi:MAG: hypothetical protein ABSH17_03870 [Syntrophobacteraceae bacterium]
MKKISHLDKKQIIEAVTDERDLDGALRRHLLECPDCRAQKEALQGRLARFGHISRSEAPLDFRKPRVLEKGAGALRPVWRIRPAFGMGMAFALILALLLSPMTLKRDRLYTQDVVYREMLQDEKFMTEIEKLVENPLPGFYVGIGDPGDDERDIQTPGAMNDDSAAHDGGSRNA